ncbi:MAG TPA: 2,3-diaminopropionate biosynthesis protein SbnB [Noviherbaspirillum sp.]|nr:2,3-diaminopropionate biosynthesis protein SbnB [Noviherbaspirillum sp.]
MFDFNIISGSVIKTLIDERPTRSISSVEAAYLAHHDGQTINPDSYFLRYPKNPANRIIALPASIDGDSAVSGIKWIASFPDNIKSGIPRASAILVLNDQQTGYPFACLEGSLISSSRTAASAVLGAYWLNERKRQVGTISFIGAGVIARNILDMFIADEWKFQSIRIHDSDTPSMHSFTDYAATRIKAGADVAAEDSLEQALRADVVVFATNAGTPYVLAPTTFSPGQIVLNISLRDIGPDLILDAENIFDDVDHCLKANTSPHLAELKVGDRRFVTCTLAQLMRGETTLDRTRPLIFSPFGMGMLDLALGKDLYDEALARGMAVSIPGFFGETRRW